MAFQLAIHARASYLELAEATIAAAEHEIGEESKRDAIANVAIGQAVVETVLEFEPKKIVAQGGSMKWWAPGQPFEEPLPVYCDVEGPNFNYEHFQSTRAGAPGPIVPTVAEERQKYVAEKR